MDTTQLTKFRVAIYGVLVENGKVLLTDTRVPSGIITNFPGGGLELGESPVGALEREFLEETSINVKVLDLLYCSRLFQQNPEYPHEQLMHIYYRVERIGDHANLNGNGDDVAQASWVARSELNTKRILAVDLEFVGSYEFRGLF
jgi:ADP-ribose pyrophosphatase YjhB (NUDIX family)